MPRVARISHGFTAISIAVVLGVALGSIVQMRPLADDYYRAAKTVAELPQYVRGDYLGWTGRWAALVTEVLAFELVPPGRGYPLLLLVGLVVASAALWSGLRALLGPDCSPRQNAAVALGLAALVWVGVPNPMPAFHWFTGLVENLLGLSIAALVSARVAARGPDRPAGPWLIGPCSALLFATGLHELFALLITGALALRAGLAWRWNERLKSSWTILFCVAAVGFLIAGFAPGNSVRADLFEGRFNLQTTYVETLHALRGDLIGWAMHPSLLAVWLLLATHPAARRWQPAWTQRDRRLLSWLLPAATLAMLTAAFAISPWATGFVAVPRTRNGLYLFFLAGWFATAFLWTRPTAGEAELPSGFARGMSSAALVVFAVGLLVSNNLRVGLWDLQDRIGPWRQYVDWTHAAARKTLDSGQDRLRLPPGPRPPRLTTIQVLKPDPDTMANTAFAGYFGLKSVRVREK